MGVPREFLRELFAARIFCLGIGVGVNALVMRDGTGGTNLAPMIVDPLITHRDANRARGEAILGDTGNQEAVTLSLPLYLETGAIEPGSLVSVGGDWVGLARGLSVDIRWDDPGGLEIAQSVQLERHYG